MDQDKINALTKKCPKFLKSVRCGIWFSDGWLELVTRLCLIIEHHINSLPENEQGEFYCDQIKEKFGGLRCYVNKSDPFIDGAIALAESLSRVTCEKCGANGTIRGEGWVRCLCNNCDKDKG